MSQLISSLMQRTISSVDMDDTVAQVEALLATNHLTWVPVLGASRGQVVGAISAWDIVNFHAQKRNADTTLAWQMCSHKPIVVDSETPLALVASLMLEGGIHHVVVTDRNGLAGVVSSLDFVRTFLPEVKHSSGSP
jgi:CBS domain-containing protein